MIPNVAVHKYQRAAECALLLTRRYALKTCADSPLGSQLCLEKPYGPRACG
jgi:hypothetical protein